MNKSTTNNDIRIVELIHPFLVKKRMLLVIILGATVLSVLLSFFLEKEFVSKTLIVPQVSGSNEAGLGKIGGLASLAGIDIENSGGSEFPPSLYPRIINSIDVQLAVLDSKIKLPPHYKSPNDSVSYREFYENYYEPSGISKVFKYTFGLPGILAGYFLQEEINTSDKVELGFKRLSANDKKLIDRMLSQVSISTSLKEGFVTISFTMPDPYLAAQMTYNTKEILYDELVKYKTSNSRKELRSIEKIYKEYKEDYETSQNRLAEFIDKNLNLNTAIAKNQLRQLEAENDLTYNVFTQIAKQREEAKLILAKSTPVLTVVEPISIPYKKSYPRLSLITITTNLFGIFLFLLIHYLPKVRKMLKQEMNLAQIRN